MENPLAVKFKYINIPAANFHEMVFLYFKIYLERIQLQSSGTKKHNLKSMPNG